MQYAVKINLGGDRFLKIGFRELIHIDREIESVYGYDFMYSIQRMVDGHINFDQLAIVIWQGLKSDDPKLTKEKTVQLIETAIQSGKYSVAKLLEFVIEACRVSKVLSFEEKEEGTGDPLDLKTGSEDTND